MVSRTLASIGAAIASTAALAAQPGSYTAFGISCPGGGKGPLPFQSQNLISGNLETAQYADEFAFGVRSNDSQLLFNVELFTRSTTAALESTMCAVYFDDGTGAPARTPATLGRLIAGPTAGLYTVYFVPPVPVTRDQNLWIAQHDTNRILPSAVDNGSAPVVPTYRRNPAGSTTAPWTMTNATRFPVWRLSSCDGRGAWSPLSIGFDVPAIGKEFTVQLHHAAESAPAVLFYGFSDTQWLGLTLPFDLTLIGANGCRLYCSGDLQRPLRTDPCGFASSDVDIPNDSGLLGAVFFNQWLILDFGVNPFGLVTTHAGRGVIGQ